MDCSLPGSSVSDIFQTRILEWVAIPFSRGSPNPGIKPRSFVLQVDSLPTEPPRKAWELNRELAIRKELILALKCCIENNLINVRTVDVEYSWKKIQKGTIQFELRLINNMPCLQCVERVHSTDFLNITHTKT